MDNKKDFRLVTIVGVLVGALALIPGYNLGLKVSFLMAALFIIGFGVFAPIALAILKLLSKRFRVLEQFGKFAAVGTLNTLIDLGILNLLILVTGLSSGLAYAGFKAISFIGGTTNSYFWNKFWTFGSRLPVTGREYIRFAGFTLVGVGINVTVASLVVTFIGDGGKLFANIGALCGVFSALLWNFLMYKNSVFKSETRNNISQI